MNFLDQSSKGNNSIGATAFTLLSVFIAYVTGQLVMISLGKDLPGIDFYHLDQSTDLNTLLVLLLIPFIFVFLTLLICVRYIHQRPLLSVFTARERFDWKRVFTSFLVWMGILMLFLGISIGLGAPVKWNYNTATFFNLLLISLFILPIQTTAEELFFRGYMMQGFKRGFSSSLISILLSGSLFGFMHVSNPEIDQIGYSVLVYYIVTGIFLGLMTHMDNGMELGMGYHAANNIFGVLILTNDWQVIQTNALFVDKSPPSFGWDAMITLLIIQPLLLLLYSRMYRWGSWREKLLK